MVSKCGINAPSAPMQGTAVQTAVSFNDTVIYQMYMLWFYQQIPNVKVFLGMIVHAIPGSLPPPTLPGYEANCQAYVL